MINFKKISFLLSSFRYPFHINVSDEEYLHVLEEWVTCSDGSLTENKQTARSRISNYLLESSTNDLNLSGLDLQSIPPLFKLSDLVHLDLSHNKLCKIDPSFFLCNPLLLSLNLSHNNFLTFDSDSFICSDSLVYLHFQYNHLTCLTVDYFKNVPNLVGLSLDHNGISSIRENTFMFTPKLTSLGLSDNCLFEFSDKILNYLPVLVDLDLTSNQLSSFYYNPDCSNLLKKVFLNENFISLENSVTLLELMYQDASRDISIIQSVMIDEDGYVMSTYFKTREPILWSRFKAYISKLNAWVFSDEGTIFQNKCSVRSNILRNLVSHSEVLDLSHFSLKSIPPLMDLLHIRSLDLTFNSISFIDPCAFPVFSRLKKLYLSNNQLTEIDATQLRFFSHLIFLSISQNRLRLMHKESLSSLKKLQYFVANQNFLTELDIDFFSHQEHLKSVSLENNSLTYLSPLIWRKTHFIDRINLSGNQLSRFEWPSTHMARPRINLVRNLFSLDTISNFVASQNVEGYRGPRFFFSVYSSLSRPISNISFDSFSETLGLWGRQLSIEKWNPIIMEKSVEMRSFYNNFNIFLNRLYNEVARNTDGSLPQEVSDHVTKVLSILERYDFEKDLLNTVCNQAFNAVSECVDRIGIVLVWLSIYCQQYDAGNKNQLDKERYFRDQLSLFQRVIQFVEDVNDCVIILDRDCSKFKYLSEFMSGGFFLPSENRIVTYEECSLSMRERVVCCLNEHDFRLNRFCISDQVEDVFLIINTLKEVGLSEMDTISMRFSQCATLRHSLKLVVEFLGNI